MNITILLTAFFLLLPKNLFSQENQLWKWLYPQPQGNSLKWVKVWNDSDYYTVGNSGTFMKTSNSGINWKFHHKATDSSSVNGSTSNIHNAFFFNKSIGFTATDIGIYKTTDGGDNFFNVFNQNSL